jgi:hypothetical protein
LKNIKSRASLAAAQHSVHLMAGILRVFRLILGFELFQRG